MTHGLRCLLILMFVSVLAACAALVPHEYLISHERLASKFDKSFPVKRELAHGMFSVTLDAPALGFIVDHNRLSLSTTFSAYSILSGTVQGNLVMTSALRYDPEQRAIFLQEPHLDTLKLLQDDSYAEMLRPALDMLLVEYLRANPLYRFQPDELRFAGTDIDITGVDVVADGISVKLRPRQQAH